MDKTKKLELINDALKFDMNESAATAYGLSYDGENLKCEVITRSADVYDLIGSLSDYENVKSFDYLSIITWGWAAPLNPNGEVDGAPSKHPQKRRVKLIISGSSAENGLLGSILTFSDEPDEPVFDFGDATGSLSDAFNDFFRE